MAAVSSSDLMAANIMTLSATISPCRGGQWCSPTFTCALFCSLRVFLRSIYAPKIGTSVRGENLHIFHFWQILTVSPHVCLTMFVNGLWRKMKKRAREMFETEIVIVFLLFFNNGACLFCLVLSFASIAIVFMHSIFSYEFAVCLVRLPGHLHCTYH